MPLRVRLGLFYGSLMALALALFASLVYVTLLNSLATQTDAQLLTRAVQVERILPLDAKRAPGRPIGTPLGLDDIPPGLLGRSSIGGSSAQGLVVQLLDVRGRVLDRTDPAAGTPLAPALAMPRPENGDQYAEVGESARMLVLVRPILEQGQWVGTIQVAASLEPTRATMGSALRLLALGTVLALGLAAVAGWWLTGRALRPLHRITSKAQTIAQTGEIGERLQVVRQSDEIGQLAIAFNAMIARLDDSAQRQRAFLADTSHELRSPLTVLRGNLDLLRRDPDPLARVEYLAEADAEARRMARLVGDLLLLAQSDARHSVQLVPMALDEVVREVYEQALMLAEGPDVVANVPVTVPVLGDADRLKQLLWNLVENALRHTPNHGRVEIDLRIEGAEAIVTVSDTGVGIAAEHLPHIFERFYKVDRARSRGKGGTGLGLAIVRHLAEAHGGRVDVESRLGVGTTFTVRLPRAPGATDPEQPTRGRLTSAGPARTMPERRAAHGKSIRRRITFRADR